MALLKLLLILTHLPTKMSKFSKKFLSRSPFKHAPEESHASRDNPQKDSEGNAHHHKENEGRWMTVSIGHDQGKHKPAEPISDEEAKDLAGGEMTPQSKALLESINKNRREEGLPEFKTLEEAIK